MFNLVKSHSSNFSTSHNSSLTYEHLPTCQNRNIPLNKQRYSCNCFKVSQARRNESIEVNLPAIYVHKGSSDANIDRPLSPSKKGKYPPLRSRY